MSERRLWIWIRIPLDALERAITALKARTIDLHFHKSHVEANADEKAAEDIKRALRQTHQDTDT